MTVGLVPVLLVVGLVIVLALIELFQWNDLRDDGLAESALRAISRLFCSKALLFGVREDDASVLIADIRSLTIDLSRIVHSPKHVENLLEVNAFWIEGNLGNLGMPSVP